MYYSSIHTDLLILGFEQDTYQVSEANNSVVVCVNITDSIERSVVINLQTMDGTLLGVLTSTRLASSPTNAVVLKKST